jgi:hypothetical protein
MSKADGPGNAEYNLRLGAGVTRTGAWAARKTIITRIRTAGVSALAA